MNSLQLTRLAALAAVFAAAAATAPAALAQTDGPQLSREAVNQETRAAMMSGHMLPAGELIAVDMPKTSTRTREERKAETLAANRNGALSDLGVNTYRTYNRTAADVLGPSTKTRAEGKAETMAAIKNKQVIRAGEAI
jgi:hypothetical protein